MSDNSGDNVWNELVFEQADTVLQSEFSSFQTGNLKLVGKRICLEGNDRIIKIPMLDPEHLDLLPYTVVVHCDPDFDADVA